MSRCRNCAHDADGHAMAAPGRCLHAGCRCPGWEAMPRVNGACPGCGNGNEDYEPVEPGQVPTPGDESLCWDCGTLGIFAIGPLGGLYVRPATMDERAAMLTSPEIAAAVRAWAKAKDTQGTRSRAVEDVRRTL